MVDSLPNEVYDVMGLISDYQKPEVVRSLKSKIKRIVDFYSDQLKKSRPKEISDKVASYLKQKNASLANTGSFDLDVNHLNGVEKILIYAIKAVPADIVDLRRKAGSPLEKALISVFYE